MSTTTTNPAPKSDLLDELRQILQEQHRDVAFVCGGSVPIVGENTAAPVATEQNPTEATQKSQPVTIRWDSAGPEGTVTGAKVTLPLTADKGGLEQLLRDMQPATFGLLGETVLDETYRKASKMDTTQFCSTFNPYELGIIDAIAQVLLPSAPGDNGQPKRAVRAELYKLNVYSGPSGRFKAHVDTPRSTDQFGSLVVCLPTAHEGGQLEVRHHGKSQTFDWGANMSPQSAAIQWAAFYSDCEHEVLEVQSGNRITLTYNLHAVRGNGQLARNCPPLDPTQMPLYSGVKDVLKKEDFMPKGGFLGFFATHAYPHTSTLSGLPDTLKGVDMSIWNVLTTLGCRVSLRPVAKNEAYEQFHNYPEEYGCGNLSPFVIGKSLRLHNSNYTVEIMEEFADIYREWIQVARKSDLKDISYEDVCWLNPPSHEELQITYIGYGNEPSMDTIYSYCAIIAEVAPWGARSKTMGLVE